jgi:hypothetical protein
MSSSPINKKVSSLVQISRERISKLDEGFIRDICEHYSKTLDEEDMLFWNIDYSFGIVESIFEDIIRKDMTKYKRFKRLFYSADNDDLVDMFDMFDSISMTNNM